MDQNQNQGGGMPGTTDQPVGGVQTPATPPVTPGVPQDPTAGTPVPTDPTGGTPSVPTGEQPGGAPVGGGEQPIGGTPMGGTSDQPAAPVAGGEQPVSVPGTDPTAGSGGTA